MAASTLTQKLLADFPLPPIPKETDKDGRGQVLIVAGGMENPGAAALCGRAAYRAGAGKVRLAAGRELAVPLALELYESRVIPVAVSERGEPSPEAGDQLARYAADCNALLIGPGMMEPAPAARLAARLAKMTSSPLVVDAAALTGLKSRPGALASARGRLVLTPHAGEMASLSGRSKDQVEQDSERIALDAARSWQAVVALKGGTTVIASPDGRCWRHAAGTVGLAVSGSGDVLAGVISGLLARGAPLDTAVLWGVYAHAEAGRRLSARIGRLGFLAREVADEVANVLYG